MTDRPSKTMFLFQQGMIADVDKGYNYSCLFFSDDLYDILFFRSLGSSDQPVTPPENTVSTTSVLTLCLLLVVIYHIMFFAETTSYFKCICYRWSSAKTVNSAV